MFGHSERITLITEKPIGKTSHRNAMSDREKKAQQSDRVTLLRLKAAMKPRGCW